jgi:hypothetical protein
MKTRLFNMSLKTLYHSIAVAVILCALAAQGLAQTAANTQIVNQASATYSDGTNNYSTVSNQVTVTVAKVAGLTITPDSQTNSSVVPGQQNVGFTFRVTNVGNFADQVRFLANGASVRVVGSATIASAVISGANTDILTNNADVLQSLAQNGYVDVVVTLNISSSAAAASTVQVFLGDASSGTNFDNVASNSSANEVRTVSTGAVNGSREARGDISVTVDRDAQARVNLTAPAGPVALGSNISYTLSACNDGLRTLSPVTGDSSVYVVAPIPAGTQLASGQTFPTGTQFTTSALTVAPLSATWVNTAPGTLSTVTRIRIPVAASIAAGACSSNFSFDVTITTTNASTAIYEIVDVFGSTSLGTTLTDQSGDNVVNKGDSNANFNEPLSGGTLSVTQGFQLPTLLQKTGSVLIGPSGAPNAVGPTNNNDDYTNKSVNTGIATVVPGGVTTAGGVVTFTNTVQNTGNADDTFTLTAPTVPAGFTVEISTNGGTSWTTVSGGGNTTVAVAYNSSASILVRVTAPAGQTVLTAYASTVRATSGIDTTKSNDTIDRLYTGFLQLTKSYVVDNQTGVGGATDAVPGADIVYTIAYSNISSSNGGAGCVNLTVNNLVITEDGSAAPNTWGTTTDQVVGSATDSNSGTIAGDSANSSVLTDTVATLAPGANGTFVFKRKIK